MCTSNGNNDNNDYDSCDGASAGDDVGNDEWRGAWLYVALAGANGAVKAIMALHEVE